MTLAWADLGRARYGPVWDLQRALVAERKAGRGDDILLAMEHERVITLGRRARQRHVRAAPEELAARGFELYEVERGGDVTYHGPGQLVVYPVLDLRAYRKDVRWYSRQLLGAVVETLEHLGVPAEAREGTATGVWTTGRGGGPAKIAALGVRIERWITYHGVALNVSPALEDYATIVPCGLEGTAVTSLLDLGVDDDVRAVRPLLLHAVARRLGRRLAREATALDPSHASVGAGRPA